MTAVDLEVKPEDNDKNESEAPKPRRNTFGHIGRLLLIALALGWLFDFLFWEKVPGISFAIFVGLCITAGLLLARLENLRPTLASLALLVPIGFFAAMSFIRLEPLTLFLNRVLALFFMAILANTLLGGKWWHYNLSDYIVNQVRLGIDIIGRPLTTLSDNALHSARDKSQKSKNRKLVFGIVRGAVLALPVVAVFAALLASADPIFSQNLTNLLDIFNIENLGEYIFRAVLIAGVGYGLAGVYLHALLKSRDEKVSASWLEPFLGFTEAVVILGSVNVLFLSFVIVQFRYFFGGQANIAIDGYTYAEYARRGFSELVVVAVLSLLLYLGLSAITKRTKGNQRRAFSSLGILLVLLVGIMLVSAFQRLYLLEQAYGFTRLRTYPHVFMIWLGILLAAVVILEIAKRQQAFALAAVLVAAGFAATLNFLNVDAFIARQNIARGAAGEAVDIAYIASLSDDVLPPLHEMLNPESYTGRTYPTQRAEIAGALACHAALNNEYSRELPWQSFTMSHFNAQRIWEQQLANNQHPDFQDYGVQEATSRSNGISVTINNQEFDCIDEFYSSR
ncbi:MAG: DUF4173 domain-containing protein [Anaerolineales bacterium]|nr:DUF4173 domain-containing protein [Anaerolineales bacterium]